MGDSDKEIQQNSTDEKPKKEKKNKEPKPLKIKKQEPKKWDQPSYTVSSSPHVFKKDSVEKVMWTVFLVLVPATLWGVARFSLGLDITFTNGFNISMNPKLIENGILMTMLTSQPFLQVLAAILACIVTEAVINLIRGQRVAAFDGSAALTGLLLAMTLPPKAPLFIAVISSVFTIWVVKHLFGGLGGNFLNPALAGRVFAMSAWSSIMYTQDYYLVTPDANTSATALETMKKFLAGAEGITNPASNYPLEDLFIGNIGGSIGEVSAIFLLLGGLYIWIKGYITWEIPLTYILTVFLVSFIIGGKAGNFDINYGLFHLLSGGLILGALFMATDMVTCPLTSKGQIIFGISLGILTVFIRIYGGYPEGVAFSVLIMNFFTPIIDRYTMPRIFGHTKVKKEAVAENA